MSAQELSVAAFVGTWDPYREKILAEISRSFPVRIWGNYWDRSRSYPGMEIVQARNQHSSAAARIIQTHAIALNIPRPQNLNTTNMRTYEIPAYGGALLTIPKQGEPQPWELASSDVASGVELGKRFMKMSRDARLMYVRRCQSLVAPHTYAARCHELAMAVRSAR
ncbi:MAG: glycosyltransferase family protein [Acidimicrobiales bacterium]